MQPVENTNRHDEKLLRLAMWLGIVIALICAFYCVENWRGRSAWNKLKQRLEAKGGRVDWTNYIPAPVPEAQNFFGDAKMQRWLAGRGGNDLSSRLGGARDDFLQEHAGSPVATVTVVERGEKVDPGNADMVLDYDGVLSALSLATDGASGTNGGSNEIIPLIALREILVREAMKQLARAAGVKYTLDPKLNEFRATITQTWTNVTAEYVLGEVLKTYHLRYLPNSQTGVGRIIVRDPLAADIALEAAAKEQFERLIMKAIGDATNELNGNCAYSAMGYTLTGEQPRLLKPVRVILRTDQAPTTNDVAAFFPAMVVGSYAGVNSRAQVTATGSNSFDLQLNPPPYVAAADYLKWSDGFTGDFDLIREALKRPCAQMEGDYHDPVGVPIPNFICQRVLAQTLTDRAKCHLLAGKPVAALQDLALVRGLCRTMEGWPDRRSGTLVATMINTAITGLYVDAIAEGIRLRAWREPELAALEEQLKEINLPPLLAGSFEYERAACCRIVENITADRLDGILRGGSTPNRNVWEKLKDPTYLLLKVGPRGWVYQNMSKVARLQTRFLEAFDATNRVFSPGKMEHEFQELPAELSHFPPYTYLAAVMVPNFTRAVQTLARNQCMADEALLACALERYRLAQGEYPKTLEALVPQWLEKIPRDIINGRPLNYRLNESGQFLLYSVGWNEKDDGGTPGLKKDGTADVKLGDWVWSYPAK